MGDGQRDRDSKRRSYARFGWAGRKRKRSPVRSKPSKRRNRLAYSTGDALHAEQTVIAHLNRPAPLPAWTVRFTLRLQLPDPEYPEIGAGGFRMEQDNGLNRCLPWPNYVPIFSAMFDGIHLGLASAAHLLPEGGWLVQLDDLEIIPEPLPSADIEEITRLADLMQAMVAGAVMSLWGGLIAGWQDRRHVRTEWAQRDMADFLEDDAL